MKQVFYYFGPFACAVSLSFPKPHFGCCFSTNAFIVGALLRRGIETCNAAGAANGKDI